MRTATDPTGQTEPPAPTGPSSFPTAPARQLLRDRADREQLSSEDLAAELQLPIRTLNRVLARDRVRWDVADRIAVALGRHPWQVWPDWFAAARRSEPS